MPKYRTVVFIHGCFWHGHADCKYAVVPQTRREWWQSKISENKSRDYKNKTQLEKENWKVLEIFECELKKNTLIALNNLIKNIIGEHEEIKYENK